MGVRPVLEGHAIDWGAGAVAHWVFRGPLESARGVAHRRWLLGGGSAENGIRGQWWSRLCPLRPVALGTGGRAASIGRSGRVYPLLRHALWLLDGRAVPCEPA